MGNPDFAQLWKEQVEENTKLREKYARLEGAIKSANTLRNSPCADGNFNVLVDGLYPLISEEN